MDSSGKEFSNIERDFVDRKETIRVCHWELHFSSFPWEANAAKQEESAVKEEAFLKTLSREFFQGSVCVKGEIMAKS